MACVCVLVPLCVSAVPLCVLVRAFVRALCPHRALWSSAGAVLCWLVQHGPRVAQSPGARHEMPAVTICPHWRQSATGGTALA
jgi:hypothetical protein